MGIEKYEDMLSLSRPASAKYPRMSLYDRAAQFSPFAALTGHEDAIRETGRLTETKAVLTEQKKEELDEALRFLADRIAEKPAATFTYFKADERKEGGSYLKVTQRLIKIDSVERCIILDSGLRIPTDDICDISVTNCHII